ncbi:MAG: hypothetical protein IIZ94_13255 [Prevotella sp.]|nr:hypothetical protein [Prevotella sp.]
MKVLEAFERIKGYCDKQATCEHCMFVLENGYCSLRETVPCNWGTPKRGDDE